MTGAMVELADRTDAEVTGGASRLRDALGLRRIRLPIPSPS
jgi:hypothetical protein